MGDCAKKCHKNECKSSQNSKYDCEMYLYDNLFFYIITRNISYIKKQTHYDHISMAFLYIILSKHKRMYVKRTQIFEHN